MQLYSVGGSKKNIGLWLEQTLQERPPAKISFVRPGVKSRERTLFGVDTEFSRGDWMMANGPGGCPTLISVDDLFNYDNGYCIDGKISFFWEVRRNGK